MAQVLPLLILSRVPLRGISVANTTDYTSKTVSSAADTTDYDLDIEAPEGAQIEVEYSDRSGQVQKLELTATAGKATAVLGKRCDKWHGRRRRFSHYCKWQPGGKGDGETEKVSKRQV